MGASEQQEPDTGSQILGALRDIHLDLQRLAELQHLHLKLELAKANVGFEELRAFDAEKSGVAIQEKQGAAAAAAAGGAVTEPGTLELAGAIPMGPAIPTLQNYPKIQDLTSTGFPLPYTFLQQSSSEAELAEAAYQHALKRFPGGVPEDLDLLRYAAEVGLDAAPVLEIDEPVGVWAPPAEEIE